MDQKATGKWFIRVLADLRFEKAGNALDKQNSGFTSKVGEFPQIRSFEKFMEEFKKYFSF